jgi:hypothetical protein
MAKKTKYSNLSDRNDSAGYDKDDDDDHDDDDDYDDDDHKDNPFRDRPPSWSKPAASRMAFDRDAIFGMWGTRGAGGSTRDTFVARLASFCALTFCVTRQLGVGGYHS